MLLHKDIGGAAGGPEYTALGGLLAVGSEFMTDRDATGEVQRSGDFVTMRRNRGGSSRLCAIHETPDAWALTDKKTVRTLDDEQYFDADEDVKFVRRSRMYLASVDDSGAEIDFANVPGYKTESRLPRFTSIIYTASSSPEAHAHERVNQVDYAAQAGKRRMFSLGDGRVLLVREMAKEDDDRWFMGVARGMSTFSRRRRRTARVELVVINPETGAAGDVLLGFDIHSGLGFDPYSGASPSALNDGRPYRTYRTDTFPLNASLPFTEGNSIYLSVTGVMWGRLTNDGTQVGRGLRGDASDTYAVAEPANAPRADGPGTYLSLVAVHPATGDTYNPQSAAPYRLTCTRTTESGEVVQSKISLPAIPGAPNHYLAAAGMELIRTSPTNIVLTVQAHAAQSGHPGSVLPTAQVQLFFWTTNNGEAWTYTPVSTAPPVFPTFSYGSSLVKDADTLLVFSVDDTFYTTVPPPDMGGVEVHEVTRLGTNYVSTIPASLFNAGLRKPVKLSAGVRSDYYPPYIGFGYGGAVVMRDFTRLWMQFDPRLIDYTQQYLIESPPARPMIITSDDGGVTWVRRFLPTVWQHMVGFVVAIDRKTLAVPILAPRTVGENGSVSPPKARIYISKDGGERWRPTLWDIKMPGYAWVDGGFLPGRLDGRPESNPGPEEYDIDDALADYNRGELFPLVALYDENGTPSPINPARPWLADARMKAPDE